jgi:hypothetical protein
VPKPLVSDTLPARINLIRLLTWLQMYLTLINFLIVLVPLGIASNLRGSTPDDEFFVLLLALAGTAIVVGIGAALVKRGWAAVHPLLFIGQFAILVDVVLTLHTGLLIGSFSLLTVIGVGWIIYLLCHPDVFPYFYGRRRSPPAV